MNKNIRSKLGFTLIELMIVIAIVGILAAVAYPSYSESVRKARRIDAMNNLLTFQIEQEKYRASHTSYAGNFTTLNGSGAATINSTEGYYNLEISGASATAFVITAAPVSGKPQASDDCGTFAVNQDGPLYSSGYAGTGCWNR